MGDQTIPVEHDDGYLVTIFALLVVSLNKILSVHITPHFVAYNNSPSSFNCRPCFSASRREARRFDESSGWRPTSSEPDTLSQRMLKYVHKLSMGYWG